MNGTAHDLDDVLVDYPDAADLDDRSDLVDEARGDAYTTLAAGPLGMSAREAVDSVRGSYNLTDAEADLVVDRLCGC